MAAEEMFVASAINTLATLGIFTVLYLKAEGWLFKHVWMMAILLTLIYSYTVESYGWQHAVVVNSLSDLAFSVIHILMWCMVLLFGWLLLSFFYQLIRLLQDIVSGRRSYGKPDEKNTY